MGWNYVSTHKLLRYKRWSLGIDKSLDITLYWECEYLSMLELELIYVSKRGYWFQMCRQRHTVSGTPSWHGVWHKMGNHGPHYRRQSHQAIRRRINKIMQGPKAARSGPVFYLLSWSPSLLKFCLQVTWLFSIFTPSDLEASHLAKSQATSVADFTIFWVVLTSLFVFCIFLNQYMWH